MKRYLILLLILIWVILQTQLFSYSWEIIWDTKCSEINNEIRYLNLSSSIINKIDEIWDKINKKYEQKDNIYKEKLYNFIIKVLNEHLDKTTYSEVQKEVILRIWDYFVCKKEWVEKIQTVEDQIIGNINTRGIIYYVSKSGNDSNSGSINHPWKTLKKWFDSLKASDTLYIREGTYIINKTLKVRYNGTVNNPITISGYPGEIVTLDGEYSVLGNHIIFLENKKHITLKNFNVTRSPFYWVVVGGSGYSDYIIFDNLKVTHTRASGIISIKSNHVTITNNEITECTERGKDECITIYNSKNVEIAYNHVHHNGNNGNMYVDNNYHLNGIGIDIKNASKHVKVHHNYVHDMQSNGIYIDSRGYSDDIKIYNNKVYNCGANGITMASETGEGVLSNVLVYNNVVYECVNGINIGYSSMPPNAFHNVTLVNNTVMNCSHANFKFSTTGGTKDLYTKNVIVANNISWGASKWSFYYENGVDLSKYTIDSNIDDLKGNIKSQNPISLKPIFIDEANKDYNLDSKSLGMVSNNYFKPTHDFNDKIRANIYNIGAYEY